LLERRIDDQARLTPAQRAERMRKRDAPAKAYEQYIDTPEGRAEQDTKKRLISFLNKYPQYKWNPFNPAGKVTNATASHIYEALEKRELPNGHLLVEGWQFASKDRVMDAIHDVARQLRCSLKKQARKH